jgi:NitT/TauT family transport system ATP-binding protein
MHSVTKERRDFADAAAELFEPSLLDLLCRAFRDEIGALFYASFFSGVIVMYEGVSQITPLYVRVAQTLGAGFQKPTTGQILFDGAPVRGPGPERGVIFQEYGVFPWLTVKQNIAFGLQLKANRVAVAERERICAHYLELMGLADFANSFPKHLSGGMRQRLAIARAYAVKPQFLLMDEPFGALDAQTRANMQNLLLKVLATEGKTVMLITHSVEEAIYLASRIVVVTARPARIKEIIDVPFAYPRDEFIQERPEFSELRGRIRELVMSEYRAQQAQMRPISFSE